jgi:hypothetical protein
MSESGATTIIDRVILNLAVALGLGVLIGGERECRKCPDPSLSPSGQERLLLFRLPRHQLPR